MNLTLSIRPSRDLRNNYSKLSKLTRENPVAITVNGKEDTVVMSYEQFTSLQSKITNLEDKLSLYEHLAMSEDDIKLGRVQSSDVVYDELLKEIDNYEL